MSQRLELVWIGKGDVPRLEPRVLLPDEDLSYARPLRPGSMWSATEAGDGPGPEHDNVLVFGDNLLALKALEQRYAGQVKCIYADPPFNTGKAFEHYDDGLDHSLWLSLLRDRMVLSRRLLSADGVLFLHLDDQEQAYAKVVMDEVFGRTNFLTSFVWRSADSPSENKAAYSADHNIIHCYARDAQQVRVYQQEDPSLVDAYRHLDANGQRCRRRLLKKNGKDSMRRDRPTMYFPILDPDGGVVWPNHDDGQEARWSLGPAAVQALVANGSLVWIKRRTGSGGEKWVPYTTEYPPDNPQKPYGTIWSDVGATRQAKLHLKTLLTGGRDFDTPKPEDLVAKALAFATRPGDLVLDSFAGSGTTGAVAHKMGRRWIMVELGEHCHTHIIPRLRKVINGQDPGGITKAVGWNGGGGFRYCRLAPTLLTHDKYGQTIINPAIQPEVLVEAVCKAFGYRYEPSPEAYWMQGRGSETEYLYVTTQTLTAPQLRDLSEQVGPDRNLTVFCPAWRGKAGDLVNLTLKKLPKELVHRCEYGQDDYSSFTANLKRIAPERAAQEALFPEFDALAVAEPDLVDALEEDES